MDILTAIKNRHSTRAFLPKAIPQQIIEQILEAARFAPSGVNMQPWHVAIVQGKVKEQINEKMLVMRQQDEPTNADYQYYPSQWFSPYTERRKACGMALYNALGITLRDKDARMQAWNNNYSFFGAPVGLLILIDHRLATGSWMDIGMFMQNIMLAAQQFELSTCAQAALAEYPDVIRSILNLESHWNVVAGIALGYEDTQQAVNQYRLEREAVNQFTRWYD